MLLQQICLGCSSVHPCFCSYVNSIVVNMISREHLVGSNSNLVQMFSQTQEWTDYNQDVEGQRSHRAVAHICVVICRVCLCFVWENLDVVLQQDWVWHPEVLLHGCSKLYVNTVRSHCLHTHTHTHTPQALLLWLFVHTAHRQQLSSWSTLRNRCRGGTAELSGRVEAHK